MPRNLFLPGKAALGASGCAAFGHGNPPQNEFAESSPLAAKSAMLALGGPADPVTIDGTPASRPWMTCGWTAEWFNRRIDRRNGRIYIQILRIAHVVHVDRQQVASSHVAHQVRGPHDTLAKFVLETHFIWTERGVR